MNLTTLRAQTRFKSGITNTTTLSNSDIDTLLNIGYHLVEQELLSINQDYFEEQKTTFDLENGQDLYSLPTDFLAFKQLRLAYEDNPDEEDYRIAYNHDASSTLNVEIQEEDISSSTPTYDITGDYYRIKPTPDDTFTKGGELYYFARNTDLSATGDTPNIPSDFHDLISVYAAKEATQRYEMWNKYKTIKNDWVEGIENIKEKLAVRKTNDVGRIRNVLEDGSGRRTTTELWG